MPTGRALLSCGLVTNGERGPEVVAAGGASIVNTYPDICLPLVGCIGKSPVPVPSVVASDAVEIFNVGTEVWRIGGELIHTEGISHA